MFWADYDVMWEIIDFIITMITHTTYNCTAVDSVYVWSHERNLAYNVGGAKSTMDVRNLNLHSSEVTKRRKIGLNQCLIKNTFISPAFTPPPCFYLTLFHPVAKRTLFLGRTKWGGGVRHPASPLPLATLVSEMTFQTKFGGKKLMNHVPTIAVAGFIIAVRTNDSSSVSLLQTYFTVSLDCVSVW